MSFEHFIYKGVIFPTNAYTEECIHFAENEFQVLDDDIYNVTYPKSGTHWMAEILNLIKYNGDPTICKTVPVFSRSPWYETAEGQTNMKDVTSPRIISSHLPFHIFAKSYFKSNAKIVYTMRNPKDVLVSLFHFAKILCFYKDPENFQEMIEAFLQGKTLYGSWFDHIKGWMQMKDDPKFFLITYEELQQDLRGSVVRICKFLGKELDDAAIDSVVEHSSFRTMKDNKMCNFTLVPQDFCDQTKGSFMRKGISGDWKNHFTVAQNEYFDRIFQEKMKDLNINFFWKES
ncbi:sulfotransferase 2B1 [Bombina bombina]|uniref:sulfotransferase 2B1 n=1 Tax=Bombina bombina TaxID=8345 RepID=UPI00235AD838|nr:sulfotransferase 2B1 [Bombina bombina]